MIRVKHLPRGSVTEHRFMTEPGGGVKYHARCLTRDHVRSPALLRHASGAERPGRQRDGRPQQQEPVGHVTRT